MEEGRVQAMLRDFCTHRLRKLAPLALALLCALASGPLHSQNHRGNTSDSATAVMHIRVNVVPMVMTPSPQQNSQSPSGITYNIPPTQPRLSITQQVRPLAAGDNTAQPAQALLRTTTVVAE
jgi:hypothetical protein